jgi:hypothetical protein
VDVKGTVLAEVRNEYNDCGLYVRKIVFDKARKIKRALVDIMKSKDITHQPVSLKEYTIGQERRSIKEAARLRNRESEAGEKAESELEESRRSEGTRDVDSPTCVALRPLEQHIDPEERLGDVAEAIADDEEDGSGDGDGDDLIGRASSGGGERGEEEDSDSRSDLHLGMSGDD